jgi:multidrug efflux pump subunit AcrA (membrane-fusion protein)
VREGAMVKAGDVIITRDTADVDQQIVMLKALSEAARAQLALIGKEATGVLVQAEATSPGDTPAVASLEQRVAELEKETQELMSRIARAEQELARSEVRVPVSGRVLALSTHPAQSPETGGAVDLEIATSDRSLLARLLDPLRRGAHGAYAAFAQPATPSESGNP